MFRALLWKEWRQIGLVRWGGIALGVLLPFAFLAGAEFGTRGWLPTGLVERYSVADLMGELLPAVLALGLWPLMALMCTAQAFAGDRAVGTESFLLERPVGRGTIWRARLAAAAGSILAVMLMTVAFGIALTAATGSGSPNGWSSWRNYGGAGIATAFLAFLGGIAASSVAPPMAAVLAGAALGGAPILLGAQLSGAFPHATFGGAPIGALLCVLLLPAYVVASWAVASRGEPAGRGRLKRGGLILGGALAAILLLFVSGTPFAMRADAASGLHHVVPHASGRFALVVARGGYLDSGGWIVEVASGKRIAFAPPPILGAAWSPDGARLALVTASGALGSVKERARIEIRNGADGRVERTIEVPEERMVADLQWGSGKLIVVQRASSRSRLSRSFLEIADPATGSWASTGFHDDEWMQIVAGDPPFVRVPLLGVGPDGKNAYKAFRLRRIDVVGARVEEPMTDATGSIVDFGGATNGVSPSGRYARIKGRGDDIGASRLADLGRGVDLPHPDPAPWWWSAGDRMIWISSLDRRTRMFVASPGEMPRTLREWSDASVGIVPSPDATAFFVSVLPRMAGPMPGQGRPGPDPALFAGEAPAGAVPEEAVYRVSEDRWQVLEVFSTKPNDLRDTQWVGPKSLARMAPGTVYFEDIDAPGKKRFVLGGEEALR
ncbi:MAG TPA: hypothetical protein VFB67_06155 [Candidatus Polarisedimenticolaceae bacterium]|nr:hypothetical protein [Candidatus Polarisedimenticolaceae bacterium]